MFPGQLDFSIEEGRQPIDVTRVVELAKESIPEAASRSFFEKHIVQ